MTCVYTDGGLGSHAHDHAVWHIVMGHIVFPDSIGTTERFISVCAGTDVSVMVVDESAGPAGSFVFGLSRGIQCTGSVCEVVDIQETERYIAQSADRKDTDRITLLPE